MFHQIKLNKPFQGKQNINYFSLLRPFTYTEISKVRASLFQINGVRKEPLTLPDAEGTPVTLNEKVYVPVKEHPDVSRTP